MINTGRAVIWPEGRGVLLVLEGLRMRYGLPGGQFNPELDSDTLDSAIREVNEELGLFAERMDAEYLTSYRGRVCCHDIYLLLARGTLTIDPGELIGIGFLGEVEEASLERHVAAVRRMLPDPVYSPIQVAEKLY